MFDSKAVLTFWFGDDSDDGAVIQQKSSLWFGKDAAVDRQIAVQFSTMIDAVVASSQLPAHQQLAQVILLDQFTRNIYRNSAKAFAYDERALAIVLEGLSTGLDQQLRPIERVFYYLPLEHSELLEHQLRSVELFTALVAQVPDQWRSAFAGFADYAIRHQVIIERFGRFPHRNAILGRASTAGELEFLQQPGSSF